VDFKEKVDINYSKSEGDLGSGLNPRGLNKKLFILKELFFFTI